MSQATVETVLRAGLARVGPEMVRVRRHLHAHPELAFQEHQTAAMIARRCARLGFAVRTGVGGTGVLADLNSGRPGPTVLVRADMDALPIQEGIDERSYRSTVPGVMHACGHDGHVAIALAVAEILADLRELWSGRVRMCFQPAEEVDEGARRMIDDGALESVDAAVGLHLQAGLQTGTVAIGPGVQWASSNEFKLTVHGSGGHAGDPQETIDPIATAAAIILELELVARDRASTMVKVAQIWAGTAPNVTPETVVLTGTLRALTEPDSAKLRDMVGSVATDVAHARGATLEVSWGADCPALVCDQHTTSVIREALEAAFPGECVVDADPSTASDDMARFLQAVPGCYFRVGATDLTAGPAIPHHHRLFDLDERALAVGAQALARAALALLA